MTASTIGSRAKKLPAPPDAHVVPRISVIGQLADDGAVELVQLDLDLEADWS